MDLFCGVGGLTYGLQKAGLKVVAGIDIDTSCEFAFTYNNKCKFIGRSVEGVSGSDIKKLLRGYDVKVLVGCAPCQPFSSHQKDKHNRSKHKDWKLLYEFARLIKEVKPHIVSMENVPELQNEEVFIDFVNVLNAEGFHVEYKIVDAANYGVPQHRRRLILLASKKKPIHILDKTHKEYVTVREAIYGLPPINAGERNEHDRLHIASSLSPINIKRIQASTPGGTWRDWPEELILPCHLAKTGKTYSSVYGRMSWNEPAATMTTQFNGYGTGRFGHPDQDRALTLREGAILQSFPPSYSFTSAQDEVVKKNIARHIGNAVPPRLGEIIGLSIQKHLQKRSYVKRGAGDE